MTHAPPGKTPIFLQRAAVLAPKVRNDRTVLLAGYLHLVNRPISNRKASSQGRPCARSGSRRGGDET